MKNTNQQTSVETNNVKNNLNETEDVYERYTQCDNCGENIDNEAEENNRHEIRSEIWCCPCFHETYSQCNRCEQDFHKEVLEYNKEIDGYVCPSCVNTLKEYEQ